MHIHIRSLHLVWSKAMKVVQEERALVLLKFKYHYQSQLSQNILQKYEKF